jgi:hypothetical protein
MIYPEKVKAKKSDKIIKILIGVSIGIAFILVLINKLTTPNIPWAALANSGILYIWITVMYSIKKNVNIAGHVLLQTIAISLLTVYFDYKLGFKEWSINISIPIIIIIANITMLVLTIVSYKKYIKYAIYQLIIVLLSMLPVVFMTENMLYYKTLSAVASGISVLNFVLCLVLCAKDVKEVIIRKFHM